MVSTPEGYSKYGKPVDTCDKKHCHHARRHRQVEQTPNPNHPDDLCHKPAGWGTQHVGYGPCRLHFGNTTAAVKAAAEQMAAEDVATFGLPTNVGPLTAMDDDLRATHGHVVWLRMQIAAMTPDELFSDRGKARLEEYDKKQRHLVDVADRLLRGKTEQELARFVGAQAELLGQWLEWLVRSMAVTFSIDPRDPRIDLMVNDMLQSLDSGELPQLETGT